MKLLEWWFSHTERAFLGTQHLHCKIPQAQKKKILSPQFPFWSVSHFSSSWKGTMDPLWQPCRCVHIASEMHF